MENTSSAAATQEQGQGWSSLPGDLLKIILDLLPWSSHPRFAAVCKHWRSVVSAPFYPAWLTPVLLNAVDIGSTNLRYYSPYHHKLFEVSFKLDTPNAKIYSARGRHLTVCERAHLASTVAHIDLVTGDIYDLFTIERFWQDFVVYDGERRRMYGVSVVATLTQIARAIQSDCGGWYPWKFTELTFDRPMLNGSPMTNPVLHRGLLYLLGVDGRLAVYDDCRHEEGLRLLDKPQGFGFDTDDASYLFESDQGELMAVLIGCRGTPVHVLVLNEQEMQWEKVDSLQGRTLFTGTAATMMVKTNVKWMQNKILLPRVHDWPELLHVHLVERGGELAFVPISTAASVAQYAGGTGIWTCGLGHQESSEFWETTKFDYSIWVDFSN